MQITSINGIEKKFHEGVAQIQQKYGNKDTKIVYEPIISKPDECRPIISQRKPPQIDVNIRNGPKDPTIRRARRLSLPMVGPLPKFTNNETKPAALTANEKTHNTNPKLLQESLPREQITIDKTKNSLNNGKTTNLYRNNSSDTKPIKPALKEPKPAKTPKPTRPIKPTKLAKAPKTPKAPKVPKASKALKPKKSTKANTELVPTKPIHTNRLKDEREWHAPNSYIYEDLSTENRCNDIEMLTQKCWYTDIPINKLMTREQRLQQKRDMLRRQAYQCMQAQHFRSTMLARKRLLVVSKAVQKFDKERNRVFQRTCSVQSCAYTAIALSTYCSLHITLNKEQKIFQQCTARYPDNTQCRVPVFDITHDLPLCREHAWKRDNYNRLSQEQKPKKITKPQPHIQPHLQPQQQQHSQLQSQSQSKSKSKPKLPKETARAAKRTKDKITYKSVSSPSPSPSPSSLSSLSASELHVPAEKRSHESLYSIGPVVANECIDLVHNPIRPNRIMKAAVGSTILTSKKPKPPSILLANFGSTSGSSLGSSLSGAPSLIYTNNGHMELHESELINHSDGIGDARLLEEHDLNNVLNQLPEDAFNEFFEVQQSDHYEPTQKEQDELARALEEVDQQVKSLEQCVSGGGATHFLDSFLDVDDEILVETSEYCEEVLSST